MQKDENEIPDYVTYPRSFENYRWYRPLLTMLIAGIIFFILGTIVAELFTHTFGLENMINMEAPDAYAAISTSPLLSYFAYLSMAVALPSIYIANRIVKDRPFSSYSSSRGGWDWKVYFKCMTIPFVVFFILTVVSIAGGSENGTGINQLTPIAFIILLILVPCQCIAEEYIFRGLLMQTLGSWLKMPIAAIIIQSIIFGVVHDYNSLGVVSIILSGVVYGILAWKTHGLEASSSMHTINNLSIAYVGALGLATSSSVVTPVGFAYDAATQIICGAAILYIGKRYGWFEAKKIEAENS